MPGNAIRQLVYVTCPLNWVEALGPRPDLAKLGADVLRDHFRLDDKERETVTTVGNPTFDYRVVNAPTPPVAGVLRYLFTDAQVLGRFFDAVDALARGGTKVKAGADNRIGSAVHVDYCCPVGAGVTYGNRKAALAQITAWALQGPPLLDGAGVNVVIVDRGINANGAASGHYGGGWTYTPHYAWDPVTISPGTATGERAAHSEMLIRIIRAIAPNVTFFDLPLLPASIDDVPKFLSDAQLLFAGMPNQIDAFMLANPSWAGRRWVIVNAWATFDLRTDLPPVRYADNPSHPFCLAVKAAVAGVITSGPNTGNANPTDIVFAAGNCGQFCPDDRCGPGDIGHGRSISGANSLPDVLTVGAVRPDGLPLGYSSQGPGMIPNSEKPDLCAPAHFCADRDPGWMSTGTSAACAVAAGVVAALRTETVGTAMPPAQLITDLRSAAKGGAYDTQLGCGILDVATTRNVLSI
jgi:hypothetical protein